MVKAVPSVSIVMPLFNKSNQVLDTIASVLAQTVSDWELVVVDDGSTDGGAEKVSALDDERIRVVRQPNNAGVSAARNRGIELAQGDLIAFLDADDLWMPEFLSTVLALQADFPSACWFATGYQIRPNKGAPFAIRLRGPKKNFKRGILSGYFTVAICSDPPVWSSATAVRRNAIMAIGGFTVGIGSGEDLLTWAKLAVRFPLAYDIRPMAVFVVSGIERRPDRADRVGKAMAKLVEQFPGADGLRAYLGLWYRMQAVMALRFDDLSLARQCALQAVRYGPKQLRNVYTLLLALIPSQWRKTLDCQARNLLGKKQEKLS